MLCYVILETFACMMRYVTLFLYYSCEHRTPVSHHLDHHLAHHIDPLLFLLFASAAGPATILHCCGSVLLALGRLRHLELRLRHALLREAADAHTHLPKDRLCHQLALLTHIAAAVVQIQA